MSDAMPAALTSLGLPPLLVESWLRCQPGIADAHVYFAAAVHGLKLPRQLHGRSNVVALTDESDGFAVSIPVAGPLTSRKEHGDGDRRFGYSINDGYADRKDLRHVKSSCLSAASRSAVARGPSCRAIY